MQQEVSESQDRYLVILVLFLSYMAKTFVFRNLVDADSGLSPLMIAGVYAESAAVAAMFACLLLLIRNIWPNVILLCVTDLWLLANVLYYNANSFLLDWEVILFTNQIRGFESSILSYIAWEQLIFPFTSIVAAVCVIVFSPFRQKKDGAPQKEIFIVLACVIVFFLGGCFAQWLNLNKQTKAVTNYLQKTERRRFYKNHSPAAHLGYVVYDAIIECVFNIQSCAPLTTEEKELLSVILTDQDEDYFSPQNHLVFILVESFEAWSMDATDINGTDVTENLNRFVKNHSVLLCKNVLSQQKYGRSGDGQLITQTGLLPLQNGVTCMRYGGNVYPNFAHFYPNSVVIDPYKNVWNQRVTTYSYGYKRLRESDRIGCTDSVIFCRTREELEHATLPTCVLAITIDTHAPFTSVPITLDLADKYNQTEQAYLQAVHYFDKHLGRFLDWADTALVMQNSTIVITADHNHFPVSESRGRCPLIIKSPKITKTFIVSNAWQMDIFPTVLSAIGNDTYSWHGFGINLTDSVSNRAISVAEANKLSDKLIRNNFFLHSIYEE